MIGIIIPAPTLISFVAPAYVKASAGKSLLQDDNEGKRGGVSTLYPISYILFTIP